MQKYRYGFLQTQTAVEECIVVVEGSNSTPAKGKDSLQQYCHQNPVNVVDNAIKI